MVLTAKFTLGQTVITACERADREHLGGVFPCANSTSKLLWSTGSPAYSSLEKAFENRGERSTTV